MARGRPKKNTGAKTVSLKVTPEAWEMLEARAQHLGMTRSDLVEAFARGKIQESNLSLLPETRALGEYSAS